MNDRSGDQSKHRPWTREEEAWLGTDCDAKIAARLGRPPATVAARRHQLRIPPAPFVPPEPWTDGEDALLGTAKDQEIAFRLNRPLGGVRGRRRKLEIKS